MNLIQNWVNTGQYEYWKWKEKGKEIDIICGQPKSGLPVKNEDKWKLKVDNGQWYF